MLYVLKIYNIDLFGWIKGTKIIASMNMLNPLNLTSEIDQKIYLVNLSIY